MRDPFAGYDEWLERPYQDMIEASDAFYEWAEEEGFDTEDNEDLRKAEEAYQDYLNALEEDRMIAAYEDAMECRAEEMMEREWDW